MSDETISQQGRRRVLPPPPAGFDALAATKRDLLRYGLPQRPDPAQEPELATLWEERARRYRRFAHLEPQLRGADPASQAPTSLFPREACGYELTSPDAPFTILAATWTVPNLHHSPTPLDPNYFRLFVGLGFLDAHVEMTVDTAQAVTALIRIHTGEQVNLTVSPGDTISAILCLQTSAAGTASYLFANETTAQTLQVTMDTGFPPAVVINAGISRGRAGAPFNPLARFGSVYFDEISAYTTSGTRLLTDGVPTSMVQDGSTLASPVRLTDYTFKIIYEAD